MLHMEHQALIHKSRVGLLYLVCFLGILTSTGSFIDYVFESYPSFITSHATQGNLDGVFFASGLRFMFRLSYVTAAFALAFSRRWGFYLCVISWLCQLVPQLVLAFLHGGMMSPDMLFSIVTLIIYCLCAAWFWPVLKSRKNLFFVSLSFLAAFLIHTVVFFILLSSPPAHAYTQEEGARMVFFKAVEDKDMRAVEMLLKEKALELNPMRCPPNKLCNLLTYAVEGKHASLEVTRLLVQAGASVDMRDGSSGDTPLIRALLDQKLDIAEYLIGAGADPMKTNNFDVSAFMVASNTGTPALIEQMVKAGAKINFTYNMPNPETSEKGDFVDGVTALMMAGYFGRADIIEALLQNGADPSLVDAKNRAMMDYIRFGQHPEMATDISKFVEKYAHKPM